MSLVPIAHLDLDHFDKMATKNESDRTTEAERSLCCMMESDYCMTESECYMMESV